MDELYKLDTVAERFGGSYAKKVVVATALNKNNSFTKYFEQRAHDMDITLVDDILEATDKALERAVGRNKQITLRKSLPVFLSQMTV